MALAMTGLLKNDQCPHDALGDRAGQKKHHMNACMAFRLYLERISL